MSNGAWRVAEWHELLRVVATFACRCSPSKTRALLRHSSHPIEREEGNNPYVERAPLVREICQASTQSPVLNSTILYPSLYSRYSCENKA